MTQGQELESNRDKSERKLGRPLNAKILQEKFCILYATRGDLPAGRCAVEAGYAESSSTTTASKLLKRPEVQARIRQVLESGEYNCVVRKPKKARVKLYSEYYEQAYDWKYAEQKALLGHQVRHCLEERYNRTMRWKDRKEGHLTHRILHKQAAQFATDYCNSLFGELNRKRPRYNKYVRKTIY
jgi:phage terminase small subunit